MRWFRKKRVYMDYASAPPVSEVALRAMRDAEKYVGNPGAIHAEGAAALDALTHARNKIAALLSVKGREIVFTSGLTEANNLALLGFARALERKHRTLARTHWLVSAIEHTSVLDCFGEIERLGGSVTFVNPDSKGRVLPDAVKRALRKETVLASVGWGNNEIGTVQQLGKIRAVLDAHERECGTKVLLHSDAGQAPLYAPSTAHSLGVDMLSVGANKLYGPHGVGALYLSNRADIVRVAHGGPQERRLRPGTESVALALGFAAAYEEVANERESEVRRLRNIRDSMVKQLCERVPGLVINGDLEYALPHMFNVSIQGIQSEYITLVLDRAGIAVSTKSACREGEESESHVVAALGGEPWRARNTLRFSLGRDTTVRDAQQAVDALEVAVNSHTA
jgi:cysteine desulfurase